MVTRYAKTPGYAELTRAGKSRWAESMMFGIKPFCPNDIRTILASRF